MAYDGFDLTGKVALVTGGTSGLGLAIAVGLARAGATVVAASRSQEKVAAAAAELRQHGERNGGKVLDVVDDAAVSRVFGEVAEEQGALDILVNSAGMIKRTPSLEVSLEEFRQIVDVNLNGLFACCQEAGRIMKEQGGGSIINIASVSAYFGFYEVTAYSTSKAAVVNLTKALGSEWAQHNIRVNAISPGVFPTPLNRHLIVGTPRGEWLRMHTAMERFGNAEELAGAAIYLASDAASYTTGETINVDGGFTARGVGL